MNDRKGQNKTLFATFLSTLLSTQIDTLEKIAELTGLQIKVFESDVVGGIHIGKNGSFRVGTSEIEIDLHSGSAGQGIMLHTASHELVHFIRQWSPEKYKILADFLMGQYGKKGVSVDTLVRRQIEKAKKAGRTLSYAEAHEEVIADSMETMLNDGKVIEKLQMLQAKDKTLFEKIRSYISKLVERIKKAYKNVKPETEEGKIVSGMLDKIEEIQQLFVDAIADASENFKGAEVTEAKISENNQVKYSFAPIDEESKYNAISRGHTILETSEDVARAIDESLKDRNLKKSYILGGIPSDVKNRITKDTNGNVFKKGGYVFKITSDHIRHIEKHFQNTDDILDAIYRLYDVVCNYDSVSPIQNGNQTRLKFEKSYWDYNYLSIEVASRKSRCLDLVTFYITKNNKKRESKIHSPAKSQDLAHQGVSLSDNTVPQTGTDVNTSISENGVKYSDRNYLEAVESGDMTTAQRMVDEAAKAKGYAYKLYHQTGNDFTVFDTRHQGAGTGDSETPFGVFMKPTSNNIGLRGQKQMAVFAKIEKPLIAADRESLMYELKKDENIKKIQDKIKMTNDNYKQKVEQAGKDLQSYLIEYRKSHPDEPRSEIYNDEGFNEIYDREDSLIEEWTSEIDKLSIDSKNAINDYLKNNGYDGVIIERDVGSFGRETETYIALDNTQVKSAEPITYDDNGNVIPLSERFNSEESDIRYSQRGKSLESKNSLWYDKHNPLSSDNRASVNPRSSINWVYKAEIFSQVENKLFHQMISEINQGSKAFEKNSVGEYMLPIENKIVFTDGNYDYPYIREIIEVMTDSATFFEEIRKVIFDVESGRTGYREAVRFIEISFGKERIVCFKNNDNRAYGWTDRKRKGANRRAVIERYQRLQDRRRNASEGEETESVKRSDRDPDALTPRNLLANALEESEVHEVEKKKLAEYKANIEKLYAKEQELYEVRKEIKELSFAPGKRDTAKLKTLREKSIELSNAVTFYDKKLLNLESHYYLNKKIKNDIMIKSQEVN